MSQIIDIGDGWFWPEFWDQDEPPQLDPDFFPGWTVESADNYVDALEDELPWPMFRWDDKGLRLIMAGDTFHSDEWLAFPPAAREAVDQEVV